MDLPTLVQAPHAPSLDKGRAEEEVAAAQASPGTRTNPDPDPH